MFGTGSILLELFVQLWEVIHESYYWGKKANEMAGKDPCLIKVVSSTKR
jgi:hypothetical protein